ncbi:MAG: hypothetical protein PHF67_05540 [Candidatus Nanoarchaeia archaeon]|nr:hypothetical protein [Candidatus Nanoarchaeia archaeon]
MNEFEKKKLKYELIDLYEGYLKNLADKEIMSKAQKLFFDYVYSAEILDRDLNDAVHGLEHIGWEYPRSTKTISEGSWKMKEDEAKKILEKLKKINL